MSHTSNVHAHDPFIIMTWHQGQGFATTYLRPFCIATNEDSMFNLSNLTAVALQL